MYNKNTQNKILFGFSIVFFFISVVFVISINTYIVFAQESIKSSSDNNNRKSSRYFISEDVNEVMLPISEQTVNALEYNPTTIKNKNKYKTFSSKNKKNFSIVQEGLTNDVEPTVYPDDGITYDTIVENEYNDVINKLNKPIIQNTRSVRGGNNIQTPFISNRRDTSVESIKLRKSNNNSFNNSAIKFMVKNR